MVAVTRHDLPGFPTPSRQEHTARIEHPWPTLIEEALLAWGGDRVVAAASYLLPEAANLYELAQRGQAAGERRDTEVPDERAIVSRVRGRPGWLERGCAWVSSRVALTRHGVGREDVGMSSSQPVVDPGPEPDTSVADRQCLRLLSARRPMSAQWLVQLSALGANWVADSEPAAPAQ